MIPSPPACRAGALPNELIPHSTDVAVRSNLPYLSNFLPPAATLGIIGGACRSRTYFGIPRRCFAVCFKPLVPSFTHTGFRVQCSLLTCAKTPYQIVVLQLMRRLIIASPRVFSFLLGDAAVIRGFRPIPFGAPCRNRTYDLQFVGLAL